MYGRDTIRRIREAVESRRLDTHFSAEDVNKALEIEFAGTFGRTLGNSTVWISPQKR
jgi:hypothetical protein